MLSLILRQGSLNRKSYLPIPNIGHSDQEFEKSLYYTKMRVPHQAWFTRFFTTKVTEGSTELSDIQPITLCSLCKASVILRG